MKNILSPLPSSFTSFKRGWAMDGPESEKVGDFTDIHL